MLGSWAAGGGVSGLGKSSEQTAAEAAARQLGAHRESVIWFLRQRLQEVAKTQQQMMETRLTREVEKNRSMLVKARGPLAAAGIDMTAPGRRASMGSSLNDMRNLTAEEEGRAAPSDNITEEQRQIFEKGNQDMLRHYESTLDKVM